MVRLRELPRRHPRGGQTDPRTPDRGNLPAGQGEPHRLPGAGGAGGAGRRILCRILPTAPSTSAGRGGNVPCGRRMVRGTGSSAWGTGDTTVGAT
ncbi:hypothetical protein SSPS47_31810 [Streptomyces sp. S4.7]|nr:hypothetical protein SSPS47_31810 [Streptomyces sp. S4.7]